MFAYRDCLDRLLRSVVAGGPPLLRANQLFDEIRVYEGVAERTGNCAERSSVRGRQGICRSMTELLSKARRLGDGYYYLAVTVWPAELNQIELRQEWTPLA